MVIEEPFIVTPGVIFRWALGCLWLALGHVGLVAALLAGEKWLKRWVWAFSILTALIVAPILIRFALSPPAPITYGCKNRYNYSSEWYPSDGITPKINWDKNGEMYEDPNGVLAFWQPYYFDGGREFYRPPDKLK